MHLKGWHMKTVILSDLEKKLKILNKIEACVP